MSTNILQWNSTEANQETDAVYAVDALRTGGAQSGAIFPSPLSNKAFYQWSSVCAALAQALVAKGYTVNDSPFSALVAVFENIKTSADFTDSMLLVNYASSITFNAQTSSGFDLTLTGNVATSSLINTSIGQILIFVISQDSVGGRTFVWPSQLTPAGPLCQIANSTSVQIFQSRANGNFLPTGPMLWYTADGVVLQPTPTVVGVTTSGTVPVPYARIVEVVNCSGGNVTRTLFSAVGTQGLIYTCKRAPGDTSTNQLIVQPQAGQTIDGFSNYGPISPYNSFDFMSDGVSRFLLV